MRAPTVVWLALTASACASSAGPPVLDQSGGDEDASSAVDASPDAGGAASDGSALLGCGDSGVSPFHVIQKLPATSGGEEYVGLYESAIWNPAAGSVVPLDGGALQKVPFTGTSGAVINGAATVVGSGLYILGGGGDGIVDQWENDTWSLADLVGHTWTQSSSPAINHQLALGVYGSQIYALGGDPGRDTLGGAQVYVLDTSAQTWSTGPSLPAPRSQLGAAVVGSTLLVGGGVCGGDGSNPLQDPPCPCTGDCLLLMASTLTLDLSTPGATWQDAPSLPVAVERVSLVATQSRFYAMSGATQDAYPPDVTSIVSWAPGEAAWRTDGCLPPGSVPLAAAMSDGTRLVIVGANATVYEWTAP